MIRSLYVHVPFCERKCEYCDFTSVAGVRGESEYMQALRHEVAMLGERVPDVALETVFVGGGTPSLVEPCSLATLLDTIAAAFPVTGSAEITLEANPSSTTRERAAAWRSAGFNRVSLGVQSLEADILGFLGRVHDARRALLAVDEVHAAGFESVNCDLIYAVPGLDDGRWSSTLDRVIAAGPAHVSCYELTVEPGTPLHRRVTRGAVTPAADAVALRQHRIAVRTLEAAGLAQYEVSNFAAPGRRCRHNLAYWHNQRYLAAGVGAHGHIPATAAAALGLSAEPRATGVRYWHGPGIAAYVRVVDAGALPIQGHESIDAETERLERVMLGLRLSEGAVLEGAAQLAEAALLREAGLVDLLGDRVRVTARGQNVLNAVAARLSGPAASTPPVPAAAGVLRS